MPFLKLDTNQLINTEISPALIKQLSQVVANETGKPERYVMVEINGNKSMLFAGNDQPLAFLACKSIGLSPAQAKKLSSAISQLLERTLAIPADRVYIEFSNCPGDFWGWNGSTFG
jgi:phenylpyruvate tautomerase PptA (4-oxalocrotonate tautomerase family)